MPELNVGHLFIRCLKQAGVQKVFTIVGDTILPLVNAAADEGIKGIDTRPRLHQRHLRPARLLRFGMTGVFVAVCVELSEVDSSSTASTCCATSC